MNDYTKLAELAPFERISKPKGGRFQQTTVKQPRNTRRDKLATVRELPDLEG